MKNLKKITALFLVLALTLCMCLAFVSCDNGDGDGDGNSDGGNTPGGGNDNPGGGNDNPGGGGTPSGDITYTVNVKKPSGELISESFIIEIPALAQRYRGRNGSFSVTAPAGEYTFTLDFDGIYEYDESMAVFSAANPTVDIFVYSVVGRTQSLQVPCDGHVDSDHNCTCDKCHTEIRENHVLGTEQCVCGICGRDFHTPTAENPNLCSVCGSSFYEVLDNRRTVEAPMLSIGSSLLKIKDGGMHYYVFTPTESGIYKFSTASSGVTEIGYYGAPHFVQSANAADVISASAFTVTVLDGAINNEGGGTTQLVLGITTEAAADVVFSIERISDPPRQIGYNDVQASPNAKPYTDLINDELVDIDVRQSGELVVLGSDGYYHYLTEDGPLVVVKISTGGNSNLADFELASFLKMTETDRLCCYFYDDDGNLTKKESYNVMIETYNSYAGHRGVVPLDKTLADAIKNMGKHMGWWQKSGEGANYIFGANAVNTENAWLFACAYVETDEFGSSSSPAIAPANDEAVYTVKVDAGVQTYVRATSSTVGQITLTFSNADGVTVTVGGVDYTAEGGIITVTVDPATTLCISSDADAVIRFTCKSI